jgi:hypothetical protein
MQLGAAARRKQSGRQKGVDEEVSEEALRNGANHGFLVPEEALAGTAGSLPLERTQNDREPGNRGYSLSWRGEQNADSGSINGSSER